LLGRHFRFAYLFAGLHLLFVVAIRIRDLASIVEKLGIADLSVTLLASPISMNRSVAAIWVVLYFAIFGSLWWYLLGRIIDFVASPFT
jgi:hypothetical protein